MPNLHRMFKAQQAIIVHATATPYRERSHFDGQDVLESGFGAPGTTDSGWLNRALMAIEGGGRIDPRGGRALGVGPVTPLVVRGRAPVMSWAPERMLPASDDTQARLLDLYRHTDPRLAGALEERIRLAAIGRARGHERCAPPRNCPLAGIERVRAYFARPPERLRAISPGRTGRASARWVSWDGIRTSTRAP